MSIFQKSVILKHLASLNKEQVGIAFSKFKENYNPEKIEQIKELKEEEYQDGFLRDIFVDVLGYTLKPNENYNLAREYKNLADSKKADGAILKDDKAIVVIELKSVKTKDLKSITDQAFNYKNNQPECKYVITSNFQKLRFYIDYANEYEEFDLFNIEKDDFDLLYLLLSKNSIFQNLPLKLKEETKFHDQEISDKLYKDYSQFKRKLFENLCKNHPESDNLTLFKKSQKLLDRFLFILFAEDCQLLPPNSISRIVERFELLKDEDAYKSLYEIFKQYFGYMNIGRKGKTADGDIPAYNGGLFYPDDLLDSFKIDDDILVADLLNLSEYDFSAEVDVNILGHIFEHSLNEIEEITAEIEGTAPDKTKSKRKKDGVFYTPKYITQYIVENTIGTLCTEKRKELEIETIEFDGSYRTKDKNLTVKGKRLYQKLTEYKEWLISLKIIDPACGSGAFLNQALNFLIEEHKTIDDIIAELTNSPLRLFDVDKTILENNLYGVDINEESVEIAKLSLWLRTAQKGRVLSTLNDNIKCGNSLIDDPEVAGDKAFNWSTEFPQIFREKEKKAWHITTATHNSRYSQRMFDNYVKLGEPIWLSEKEEEIVTETVVDIAEKDKLNIIAYNVCGDHMHLLLVCEEKEVPNIVGKIKAMSARACNIEMGRTVSAHTPGITTREHAPLSTVECAEHAPLSTEISPETRGETQAHLWTQKFGCKEIKSDEQLNNTIAYIQNNRQKHKLSDNIKLRNLINRVSCSREHAFRTEYKGGFDVVIGNPPYVHLEKIRKTSEALAKVGYKTYDKRGDLYSVFVEKGINILKPNGLISYIMPNKWLQAGYGKSLREFFLTHHLIQLIDFGDIQIFDGATTYPCIFILEKGRPQEQFSVSVLESSKTLNFNYNVLKNAENFSTDSFSGETWVISSGKDHSLLNRLNKNNKTLKEFVSGEANYGIKTGFTEAFLIDEATKEKLITEDANAVDLLKPVLRGRDIKQWVTAEETVYLIGTFPALKVNIEDYPSIKKHLLSFGKDRLEQAGNKGSRKKTNNKWFETQDAIDYWSSFLQPKIMYQKFQVKPCFIYDEQGLYCNDSMWIIPTDNKALLGVLNSKMGWWLITKYCTQIQNGVQLIWKYFGQIPIPELSNSQLSISVDSMLNLNQQLQEKSIKFINRIRTNFLTESISKKLESFYDYDFKSFLSELQKQKIKLSLVQQDEWEEYFNIYKNEINQLQAEIAKTDKEIDQMVYALYELTEEEIAIVESVS